MQWVWKTWPQRVTDDPGTASGSLQIVQSSEHAISSWRPGARVCGRWHQSGERGGICSVKTPQECEDRRRAVESGNTCEERTKSCQILLQNTRACNMYESEQAEGRGFV